jgi:LPS sulfotransferase NodH
MLILSDDHSLEESSQALFTKTPSEYATEEESQGPRRFIVFGNQRTGSTLVASKLNSHYRIVCYEEIFLPWVDSSPSLREWLNNKRYPQWLRAIPRIRGSFLNSLFDIDMVSANAGAVGFKVMYDQFSLWPKLAYVVPRVGQAFCDHRFQRWLRVNHVVIVHTLRRNHLKVLVSHELAVENGRFHSRDGVGKDGSVVIPLRGLKARLSRIEAAEKVARKMIKGLSVVEIIYEDYTGADGTKLDASLCAALGQSIPESGLTTQLTKVSSDNLRDTIRNYAQVADYLSGSRYERFLK